MSGPTPSGALPPRPGSAAVPVRRAILLSDRDLPFVQGQVDCAEMLVDGGWPMRPGCCSR